MAQGGRRGSVSNNQVIVYQIYLFLSQKCMLRFRPNVVSGVNKSRSRRGVKRCDSGSDVRVIRACHGLERRPVNSSDEVMARCAQPAEL